VKKILFILLLAIPVLFIGIWIAVPPDTVQGLLEDFGDGGPVTIQAEGFKKGLLYRFSAERLLIKHRQMPVVSFQNVSLRIDPSSLVALRMRSVLEGEIGGGKINGTLDLAKKDTRVEIDMEGVRISEVPFFRKNGIEGSGILSGTYTMIEEEGRLEFLVEDAQFEPVVLTGKTIPLNFFHTVRGYIDVRNSTLEAVSVSFEGKDIYARMKGKVQDSLANLAIEVMPEAGIVKNPLFLHEFRQYEVSPGYYVIPVK
jgi:type II secretion system protein N